MGNPPVASGYAERLDYRVDLLARTNAMAAWLGGDLLAASGACLAWSYPEPLPEVARLAGYVAFDQEAVRVTIGKGVFTGMRP
jgi:uncharacterized protein (DUF427 family)